ncbi:MAG: AraC family transcriptional regulator [Ginsengibacter sp.]
MKLLETHITPFINNFLHVESREQPFLYSPHHGEPSFHCHPELELTFVQEGFGKRIIGSKVTDYDAGDMVFIGSGVPHVYLSDPSYYKKDSKKVSKVIVVYINPKLFEPMLSNVNGLENIKEMINQSGRGINIHGQTKETIGEILTSLSSKTGFEKIEGVLHILHILSVSTEKTYVLNENVSNLHTVTDRMNNIIDYIKKNLNEQITLEQVAGVACLTVPSFCRFFKKRTRMTFFQYLTKLRIAQACKLLIELDKSVSYIANMCGYNSDSHFCKVFKDHMGQSPYQYKASVNAGYQ